MPRSLKILLGIVSMSLTFAFPAWAFKEATIEQSKSVEVEKQLKEQSELNSVE